MQDKQDKRQVLQIVWLLLLGSLTLYAAIPLFVPAAEQPPAPMVVLAVLATAATVGAMAFVLPPMILRGEARDETHDAERRVQAKIVQLAFDESIGVFGLVLYVLGAGTIWLWGMCAAAAILMGMHAPREVAAGDSRDLVRPDVKIG